MIISKDIYETLSFLVILIFLVLTGISLRKRKVLRTWIFMGCTLLLAIASVLLVNLTGTLYLIKEDYSCTKYYVFGKSKMSFDSPIKTIEAFTREYEIDPGTGNTMVVNRSFVNLHLQQIPISSTNNFGYATIPPWRSVSFEIPEIDYLPADGNIPAAALYKGAEVRYWLSKE